MDKIEFDNDKYPDGISETLNFLDHEELVVFRKYIQGIIGELGQIVEIIN